MKVKCTSVHRVKVVCLKQIEKEINKINTDMRIDLVKDMLTTKADINFISQYTRLTVKEIKKIKKDMGL